MGMWRLLALVWLVEAEDALPRIKWGQSKEKLFVTFVVRDLDRSSVWLDFDAGQLRFKASDSAGKGYSIDLELAQDIEPALCKWEQLPRKDRWGEAVLATLTKVFPAAWSTLAADAKRYLKVIDRDWSRDDGNLETSEDTFFEEHAEYLPRLQGESELLREMEGVEAVVLLARHSACEQCVVADKTFAEAARKVQQGAKMEEVWRRLKLFVAELPKARLLARRLGRRCAATPRDCRYFVFSRHGGLVPVALRGRHDEVLLMANLKLIARRQFLEAEAPSAPARSLVLLPKEAAEEDRQAAHQLRLRLDVGIAKAASERASAWRGGEAQARHFESGSFSQWLQNFAVPCLGNVRSFADEEPYEELGLPVGRLYLDGGPLDAIAKEVLCRVSGRFFGSAAFMAKNATLGSSDWRQHGLPPGLFPAFAIASSTEHNATRFAYLGMPKVQSEDFWRHEAEERLSAFVKEVLSGMVEQTRMSELPPDEDRQEPANYVRKLVGRRCQQVVEDSPVEALIEGFDEYRRDHPKRTLQLDLLAPMLAVWNITVWRLDFGANECPPDLLRPISAGYSGYFFVHPHARQGRKLQKLKKLDPDFGKVMSFVQKHSSAKLVAADIADALETAVLAAEQKQNAVEWWPALLAVIGLLLAVLLVAQGRRHDKSD